MSNIVVRLVNVSKSFGDKKVLNNIQLEVHEGEFLTLLGPSGCGKTTLLRLLAGFEHVDAGKIFINQVDVASTPPQKRRVNTVFQSYALFPHLTVFQNVAFGLKCKKIANQEIKLRVIESLQRVKMADYINAKPHQLSGGQQQRIAIARAMVNQPSVLLLDESLSSLDYRLRKSMQIELRQLQRKIGMTFIFITHDQEEALSMSDRVAVMIEGKIAQLDTPRVVYEQPKTLKVAEFIGDVNLFNCALISQSHNAITVRIEGKDIKLPYQTASPIKDKVHVLIRPEDFRVWGVNEVDDPSAMLAGCVREIIYKGSTVQLTVELESGRLIEAIEFFDEDDEDLVYRLNEKVFVHWIPGWEVILPYEY